MNDIKIYDFIIPMRLQGNVLIRLINLSLSKDGVETESIVYQGLTNDFPLNIVLNYRNHNLFSIRLKDGYIEYRIKEAR